MTDSLLDLVVDEDKVRESEVSDRELYEVLAPYIEIYTKAGFTLRPSSKFYDLDTTDQVLIGFLALEASYRLNIIESTDRQVREFNNLVDKDIAMYPAFRTLESKRILKRNGANKYHIPISSLRKAVDTVTN